MDKFKVVVITVAPVDQLLVKVLADLENNFGLKVDLRLYSLQESVEQAVNRNLMQKDLAAADCVLLDLMGVQEGLTNFICSVLAKADNAVIPTSFVSEEMRQVTRLGSFSLLEALNYWKKMMMKQQSQMNVRPPSEMMMDVTELVGRLLSFLPPEKQGDARNWVLAHRYWTNSGRENLTNLLLMLARYYKGLNVPEPEPPQEIPDVGIYRPETGKIFINLEDYLANYPLDETKATIGIVFYQGRYGEASQVGLNALLKRLEPFCNVIPVFFYTAASQKVKALREYFCCNGKPLVEAVINLTAFRLNVGPRGGDPGPTITELKQLNVPIFHPVPMSRREIREWEEAESLTPVEVIVQVILPELDGCIEPIPISGLQSQGHSPVLGMELKGVAPIEERVDKIAGRVFRWLRLRRKPNAEKRIAVILYNYPPGEDNIGGAACLDVFASMKNLLAKMKEAGYTVGELPEGKLYELFLEQGIVNSGRWVSGEVTARHAITLDKTVCEGWFRHLPGRENMLEEWGPPPGEVMAGEDQIILPGIVLGNVFIGLQPTRGLHEKPEKVYHDKAIPPHYQYIAFYKWLEEAWGADACIHVGTHGTLEFTKGKEVGMSGDCFPDLLIGNMPHLYIYHVANPSEAMIAKRRSLAVLVNYNSPPVTTSDLYEELAELEMLIAEYHEAVLQDPLRSKKVKKTILEKAERANFASSDVDEIHDEIFRIKRSIIPKGLHILDESYSLDEVINFVALILRYDRGDVQSLNRLLCQVEGIDYDEAIRNPARVVAGKSYADLLIEIESKASELVRRSFHSSIEEAVASMEIAGELASEIKLTLAFGHKVAQELQRGEEITALLEGLNGEYIQPNLGGDPIRTPEALPTGRNTYQFDPRMVPTEAAYARGAEIAENTIAHYCNKYGCYPKSTAVILWGFETTKSQGETVGQILRYLGVRVTRKKNAWSPQLEVIPLEELARPRIDVVVNMCGFFRDMFPNVMELLDEAFNLVATLDEPVDMNYVKENSLALFEELKEQMDDHQAAWVMARGRIFGPPAGEYGTRVRGLVETQNWNEEGQLADAYLQSMNHLYTRGIRARRMDQLFRRQLSRVDVISQVRCSHDYEITDLDHYYEYFGGLAKSVEVAGGKKPEMLFSDTTKEVIITEDVEAAIRRGVRTRLLNPKWIESLLAHEYHGVQHIADRVDNVLGLAATTNRVDNWIWSKIAERYVFNEEMRKRLEENNRWATAEIIRRLFEANTRGYWQATAEELDKLREAYLELEGSIEEKL
ncbi:MAG: magnesium chelatase subunit H [Bacillota bacterium]